MSRMLPADGETPIAPSPTPSCRSSSGLLYHVVSGLPHQLTGSNGLAPHTGKQCGWGDECVKPHMGNQSATIFGCGNAKHKAWILDGFSMASTCRCRLIREDGESAQCCAHTIHTRQDRCQAPIRTTSPQTRHTSCEENNSSCMPASRRLPIVFEPHGPAADRPERVKMTIDVPSAMATRNEVI